MAQHKNIKFILKFLERFTKNKYARKLVRTPWVTVAPFMLHFTLSLVKKNSLRYLLKICDSDCCDDLHSKSRCRSTSFSMSYELSSER